ncbi:hypothetical protein DFR86_07930 [Acidianus sulfidivorans JP7]|uniref:Uncharacterized protein n=1 Tax=Acidianus sulfidivorans JP7 TaxID=619593 RepID=A0A2U9INA2_9CREN|nr:hypothetical protein [Acidianus sulfidivorans]AWR97485.1 hypothetical protein DFR86_07930 [Acidianus sulfidivorans JP7]
MKKIIVITFLIPLLLIPLSFASVPHNTTQYAYYSISYTKTANLTATHNMSNIKGSLAINASINLNISSTSLSNGKFNDTISIIGYVYHEINANISGLLVSSAHNTSIDDKISFVSNYSIENITEILSLLNMFNITYHKVGNTTFDNITVLYSINLAKVGEMTVILNGVKYTGYEYSVNGSITTMSTPASKYMIYSESTDNGTIVSLNNGLVYSASLSGQGITNVKFMIFNMTGKSNDEISVKLLSTNVKNSNSMGGIMPPIVKTSSVQQTSQSNAHTSQITSGNSQITSKANSISIKDIIIPAGVIASIAVLIILIRKLL